MPRLFPESYLPWLADRLPGSVEETLATCDSCAMVKPEGLTRDPGPFLGDLKCCTYFPFVPNFGLGAMYESKPETARVRLAGLADRGIVLPLGLFPTPEYQERIEELGSRGFGRKRELLCPFFDTATMGCSVWSQRPGVCTSYFCKSDRGASGLEFWADVETYLNAFEWALATEVYHRLGFTEDDLEISRATMTGDDPGEERRHFVQMAWGSWSGREEEFFRLARKTALEISAIELAPLLDDETLALEESLRSRV